MSARRANPDDILQFWFLQAGPTAWYKVSAAFDARMRRKYARHVEREARLYESGRHDWLDTPGGALALVLMFDQFPRNIWRGSGRAFAFDPLGLDVARRMIDKGFDWALPEEQRAFVYMPFMHSETLADQHTCIDLATERLSGTGTAQHARKHCEVIERFGRFPYRNDALGRECTPEETAYLDGGGYAPGSKRK